MAVIPAAQGRQAAAIFAVGAAAALLPWMRESGDYLLPAALALPAIPAFLGFPAGALLLRLAYLYALLLSLMGTCGTAVLGLAGFFNESVPWWGPAFFPAAAALSAAGAWLSRSDPPPRGNIPQAPVSKSP